MVNKYKTYPEGRSRVPFVPENMLNKLGLFCFDEGYSLYLRGNFNRLKFTETIFILK